MIATAQARGHDDPIRVGVLLGLLLFVTIVVLGRGLGASGAFAAGAASAVATAAPGLATANPYVADRVPTAPAGLLGEWIVLELVGLGIGAWLSARAAGRAGFRIERSGAESGGQRVARAALGGAFMGAGARLAHGCTSGLALSGGAMLATGAWLFIPIAFGSAFAMAWLLRRSAPRMTA